MGVAKSAGIGGSFRVESVAGLPWNGWQLCYGISGSFRVEYAPMIKRAPKLYNGLFELLKPSFWLDKRHRITFVWMVVGLIESAKINLSEWTPFVVGRARFAQSRERRFKRWLYNERIEALALYRPLIQNALQDWRAHHRRCPSNHRGW